MLMWQKCAVTDCSVKELLIASHIKPWHASNNEERLDHYNGFILLASIDKAFDCGLISFDDNGNIMISPSFKDYNSAGIKPDMSIDIKEKHKSYLAYHRENIFIKR